MSMLGIKGCTSIYSHRSLPILVTMHVTDIFTRSTPRYSHQLSIVLDACKEKQNWTQRKLRRNYSMHYNQCISHNSHDSSPTRKSCGGSKISRTHRIQSTNTRLTLRNISPNRAQKRIGTRIPDRFRKNASPDSARTMGWKRLKDHGAHIGP